MKKVVLCLVVLTLIIGGCILTSPMSNAKALERAKTNIKNGACCAGYHNNSADGTRVVVFRNKETNEIVDKFEVNWDLGSEIYQKYKKEGK